MCTIRVKEAERTVDYEVEEDYDDIQTYVEGEHNIIRATMEDGTQVVFVKANVIYVLND